MPVHRMISRNIHEYISYITCIPKCERCYYAGPGYSSYVRPRMEIGSRSLEGRESSRESIYNAYYEENVPRNAPRGPKRG